MPVLQEIREGGVPVKVYTGDIEAADSVSVMPGAAGRVEAVLVEVGDELKAGDPIATIEWVR